MIEFDAADASVWITIIFGPAPLLAPLLIWLYRRYWAMRTDPPSELGMQVAAGQACMEYLSEEARKSFTREMQRRAFLYSREILYPYPGRVAVKYEVVGAFLLLATISCLVLALGWSSPVPPQVWYAIKGAGVLLFMAAFAAFATRAKVSGILKVERHLFSLRERLEVTRKDLAGERRIIFLDSIFLTYYLAACALSLMVVTLWAVRSDEFPDNVLNWLVLLLAALFLYQRSRVVHKEVGFKLKSAKREFSEAYQKDVHGQGTRISETYKYHLRPSGRGSSAMRNDPGPSR